MQHLFRMFSRLKEGSQLDKNGIGLGLSICKNIVSQYGGEITVSSEFGKGSTFCVTFALTEERVEEHKNEELINIPDQAPMYTDEILLSERSLRVEDHPLIRRD